MEYHDPSELPQEETKHKITIYTCMYMYMVYVHVHMYTCIYTRKFNSSHSGLEIQYVNKSHDTVLTLQ